MCVCGGDHTTQRYRDGSKGLSGRIEGIGGIGRDRKGSEGSLPIVRDRKRSEVSEKLKNGRGLRYNWKLGNWELGKLGNWEIGKL